MNLTLGQQVLTLVILAIPISSIAWTITHEEIFRETRDWCVRSSKTCRTIYERKFFYLFTCEYCFSHYVTCGDLRGRKRGKARGFQRKLDTPQGFVTASANVLDLHKFDGSLTTSASIP
jgi:hypothetical protein